MQEYKILFTGPMGAGKTTAISVISETPPVITDVANTDTTHSKELTTVGLDFGTLTLGSGDRIRLFGTPGQKRFDFLWSILATDALGIIILIDNSAPDSLEHLMLYVEAFNKHANHLPCVIGVGRTDTHPHRCLDDYTHKLSQHDYIFPVVEVDVRKREDVSFLIDILLTQIEADLQDAAYVEQ